MSLPFFAFRQYHVSFSNMIYSIKNTTPLIDDSKSRHEFLAMLLLLPKECYFKVLHNDCADVDLPPANMKTVRSRCKT